MSAPTGWRPVTTRLSRRLRHYGPGVVLGLVVLLSGVSLWQAWDVSGHLRSEARGNSRIFGQVIAALGDTTPGAHVEVLLHLVTQIRATGLPVVVTDTAGRPTSAQNLPFDASPEDPRVADFVRRLDQNHPPIAIPGLGEVHFGDLPVTRRLRLLAALQFTLLISAVAAGFWAYHAAMRRDQDRLWVAMARESAHQLGTPLMSANAWIDRLTDGDSDVTEVSRYLKADLERLQRVAQRFERIGRPARRDRVGLGAVAERVAHYFTPRLPRHAHQVTIVVEAPDAGPFLHGDAILLEWAVEAMVRNAIDALSGRGGTIRVEVGETGNGAAICISDNGPGVPAELRARVFEPGVTSKPGGWGIGLALTRRIIEDVHEGSLRLMPSEEGAAFLAEIPTTSA